MKEAKLTEPKLIALKKLTEFIAVQFFAHEYKFAQITSDKSGLKTKFDGGSSWKFALSRSDSLIGVDSRIHNEKIMANYLYNYITQENLGDKFFILSISIDLHNACYVLQVDRIVI